MKHPRRLVEAHGRFNVPRAAFTAPSTDCVRRRIINSNWTEDPPLPQRLGCNGRPGTKRSVRPPPRRKHRLKLAKAKRRPHAAIRTDELRQRSPPLLVRTVFDHKGAPEVVDNYSPILGNIEEFAVRGCFSRYWGDCKSNQFSHWRFQTYETMPYCRPCEYHDATKGVCFRRRYLANDKVKSLHRELGFYRSFRFLADYCQNHLFEDARPRTH